MKKKVLAEIWATSANGARFMFSDVLKRVLFILIIPFFTVKHCFSSFFMCVHVCIVRSGWTDSISFGRTVGRPMETNNNLTPTISLAHQSEELPDRPFHKFSASRSGDRPVL